MRNAIKFHLSVIASLWFAAATLAIAASDAEISLDSVYVEGQRLPFDSRRPEYERLLPCLGCEPARGEPAVNWVEALLRYALLPSEPPDLREYTPIVLRQPIQHWHEQLP